MTNTQLFACSNTLAMGCWILLAAAPVLPRYRDLLWRMAGAGAPLLMSVGYTWLIANAWGRSDGGFGSIDAVRRLFQDDQLLLAGWLHYLAFDLFVGYWIVRRARALAIPHLLVLPVLPLTLMFGPIGYLTFSVVAAMWSRRSTRSAA